MGGEWMGVDASEREGAWGDRVLGDGLETAREAEVSKGCIRYGSTALRPSRSARLHGVGTNAVRFLRELLKLHSSGLGPSGPNSRQEIFHRYERNRYVGLHLVS